MPKITKPTLLINKNTCRTNIKKMADKAQQKNVLFRPHFKTHQSLAVANLFKEQGVTKITVSSVEMASYFANNGWNNITIAFPINILEIDEINTLAEKITLNIIIESIDIIPFLNDHLRTKVSAFLKIDTGYHRTGIDASNLQEINILINELKTSNTLQFLGFLVHSGNSYQAKNVDEIKNIHNDSLEKLAVLKNLYPDALYSIGDTPSCSVVENFEGIDEIRPGNFVYYDAMQLQIGSCKLNDIAAVMACPVVAKHPERNEIVIYGGAVHFSKEKIDDKYLGKHYGLLIKKNNTGNWEFIPNAYLNKLSQEHGIIHCSAELISATNIGDIMYFIPIHSCLTANLMKQNTLFV